MPEYSIPGELEKAREWNGVQLSEHKKQDMVDRAVKAFRKDPSGYHWICATGDTFVIALTDDLEEGVGEVLVCEIKSAGFFEFPPRKDQKEDPFYLLR